MSLSTLLADLLTVTVLGPRMSWHTYARALDHL